VDDKKILNEEHYEKNRKKFLWLGFIGTGILILGAILTVMGFASFGSNFGNIENFDVNLGSMGLFAFGGILCAIGLPMTLAGFILYHSRGIANFGATTIAPVAEPFADRIARGVKSGLSTTQNVEAEIARLDALRQKRVITEDEYKKMRNKALGIDK